MNVAGRTAVVTGGGRGIGAALGVALVEAGAKVLLADLDADGPEQVVAALEQGRAIGISCDVSDEDQLEEALQRAERDLGPVDLFFANAGVATGIGLEDSDAQWQAAIEVNVMAHVRAARLLIPRWLERGEGYFVATASAAGLLTQLGSAPYAVTKHGALAFAEWLAVTYGDRGVSVSCLCPMGVQTAMLESASEDLLGRSVMTAGKVLGPSEVARETLAAVADERFLVLPHPEVLEYFRHKGADYDRWLASMRRFQRQLVQVEESR